MTEPGALLERPHRISVVVPVYQGEKTLGPLLEELVRWTSAFVTPDGHEAVVSEVVLVHDHGPDRSDEVIRSLAAAHPIVRPLWLSRNFGQHAATLAGMSAGTGDWVVTMDEDGQHDPAYVPAMLDTAMREQASLVYAAPVNAAPHGFVRNLASRLSKRIIDNLVGGDASSKFHSYRLLLGDVARRVASYAGTGVYLDIAVGWVAGEAATCPVRLREEGDRRSGYRLRTLVSHFWRMVLTAGTRPLRLVAVLGMAFAGLGLLVALVLVLAKLTGVGGDIEPGWTSVMVVVLLSTGALLFALGVVAEYLGMAVDMALGKPPYLVVEDPVLGPLGRAGVGGGGGGAPASPARADEHAAGAVRRAS